MNSVIFNRKLRAVCEEALKNNNVIKSKNDGILNPNYSFIRNNKNLILQEAKKSNPMAVYVVNNINYFNPGKIDFKLEKLVETIKKNNGILKTTESNNLTSDYIFIKYHKEKIISLAQAGNEPAIYLVNNVRYLQGNPIDIDLGQQITKFVHFIERNEINIKNGNMSKAKKWTNFILTYENELITLATQGNQKAKYLLENLLYFKGNPKFYKKLVLLKESLDKSDNNRIGNSAENYWFLMNNKDKIVNIALGVVVDEISAREKHICLELINYPQFQKTKEIKLKTLLEEKEFIETRHRLIKK